MFPTNPIGLGLIFDHMILMENPSQDNDKKINELDLLKVSTSKLNAADSFRSSAFLQVNICIICQLSQP